MLPRNISRKILRLHTFRIFHLIESASPENESDSNQTNLLANLSNIQFNGEVLSHNWATVLKNGQLLKWSSIFNSAL